MCTSARVEGAAGRKSRGVGRGKVGMSEAEAGAEGGGGARESRKVGGQEGVPLTITPPLERHRPDAWTEREIGRKGIEPKVIAWIRRGAAGLR